MSPDATQRTTYKLKESYRKQLFGAIINKDPRTQSWSWKGHIDFEEGPYSEFTSRRSFNSSLEAEEHLRRFVRERIDSWLSVRQPGSL